MLLILRKLKRNYFSNKEFRKYLLYALGEVVLIIIGILIALQIDNWNTDRIEQASLDSYLRSIARNVESDLAAVANVRSRREETYEASVRTVAFIVDQPLFEAAEIAFANHAFQRSQEIFFFDPNTSGYDALKSSGVLDQMQGTDIERLLYDYYETVSRITHAEENHNDYVRALSLQVVDDWPEGMTDWELALPRSLAADRFQALQASYLDLLTDVSMVSLYRRARTISGLLIDYKNLNLLGTAYLHMAQSGLRDFDDTVLDILEGIFVPHTGLGYANIITNGQVTWHSYEFSAPSSTDFRIIGRSAATLSEHQPEAFRFDSFQQVGDSLHIDYPGGADWAVISTVVRGSATARTSLDFSGFDKLVLELRGDQGGEIALVHLKDSEDPDDGSQTNIPLTLTDQWQTYEIDLADFETADLSKLHLVLGFLFFNEPQSFSVKNVTYLKTR